MFVKADAPSLLMVEPIKYDMGMVIWLPVFPLPKLVHPLPFLTIITSVHIFSLTILQRTPVTLIEVNIDTYRTNTPFLFPQLG